MVPKQVSPLVGFNNNVKHRGRIFHVQTEDSGIHRPRIVTHLFADGGRIIKSTKTDYSEHVGRKDMTAIVRRMMKEQHKAMFIALRDGQFDQAIEQVCGALPEEEAAPRAAAAEVPPAAAAEAPPAAAAEAPPAEATPSAAPRKPALPARREKRAPTLPELAVDPAPTPAVAPPPVPRRPAPSLADVALADLGAPPEHRTSAEVQTKVVLTETPRRSKPAPRGTPILGTPAVPNGSRRYAAPRPAAIFSEPPAPESASIFGGSSISEQSLDEVILSYLAEDLETE